MAITLSPVTQKLTALAIGSVLSLGLLASPAHAISIAANADGYVSENGYPATNSGNWSNPFTEAVWRAENTSSGRNEWIALRFDLTGVDKSQIAAASIDATMFRTNNANDQTLLVFATDGQTWANYTTNFSIMPGLTADGTTTTRGENTAIATNLGTAVVSGLVEGDALSLQPSGLLSYIQNMSSDTLTILITYDQSNASGGKFQIATSEATSLNTSGAATAGTYTPVLTLAVPEPASVGLFGVAAMVMAARRR